MKTGKKVMILLLVFAAAAMVYFVHPVGKKEEHGVTEYTAMEKAKFPVLYATMGEREMAPVFGQTAVPRTSNFGTKPVRANGSNSRSTEKAFLKFFSVSVPAYLLPMLFTLSAPLKRNSLSFFISYYNTVSLY